MKCFTKSKPWDTSYTKYKSEKSVVIPSTRGELELENPQLNPRDPLVSREIFTPSSEIRYLGQGEKKGEWEWER